LLASQQAARRGIGTLPELPRELEIFADSVHG
jgi:hypothetical protein